MSGRTARGLVPAVLGVLGVRAVRQAAARSGGGAAEEPDRVAPDGVVRAFGFVPEGELDTVHDQPVTADEAACLGAVGAGEWEAAADWVAGAGRDWEERRRRVGVLAGAAARDGAWLAAWEADRPGDVAAALVVADAAVRAAWDVHGARGAERLRHFRELLLAAQRAAYAAQEAADPGDPVPYVVEQRVGTGLGYPHARYEELWGRITARAPRLLCAHTAAVEYWTARWRGSHELALGFARRAADGARPGELLRLLPLIAYFEDESGEQGLPDHYKRPEVVEAVDAALADLAAAAPGDRRTAALRHMLAWMLFWQDRDAEAVEQFRAVDGYVGALPWTRHARPERRYAHARDWAARVAGGRESCAVPGR
ncbi:MULTISPECIES: hypothetical protein [Streptomyces]|uniref:hypothetical protein n=1 Tax=Streptomyces TaxID=1883 RepID=UPI001674957E|nr:MULTISPECIES: hypothetical protein [Streptomyces]MBD3576448.1 hypothetical protein [Streptomyces sp. KD18]GGS88366.1 hypothetical protein GCM10010286_11400 [Streptomyces toxytricini]